MSGKTELKRPRRARIRSDCTAYSPPSRRKFTAPFLRQMRWPNGCLPTGLRAASSIWMRRLAANSGCRSKTSRRETFIHLVVSTSNCIPSELIRYTDSFDDPNLPGIIACDRNPQASLGGHGDQHRADGLANRDTRRSLLCRLAAISLSAGTARRAGYHGLRQKLLGCDDPLKSDGRQLRGRS